MEQIYKRIVRDRLHYHDLIFCAAGRIVRLIHLDVVRISTKKNPIVEVQSEALGNFKTMGGDTNFNATYYAFHIRRGDFQYKETQLGAEKIWNNTRHLLDKSISNLIYISTDEKDKGPLYYEFNMK
jgi:hypothetical protein